MTQDFDEYTYETEDAPEEETVTLATPGDRLLAWIVDALIFTGIGLVVAAIAFGFALSSRGNNVLPVIVFGLALLAVFAYFVFVLAMIARDGQSPGKKVVKIRVITVDGSAWGWKGTLVRELLSKGLIAAVISGVVGWIFTQLLGPDPLGIAGTLVYLVLFIWIVVDENNQTLHDKIANTYVVKVS